VHQEAYLFIAIVIFVATVVLSLCELHVDARRRQTVRRTLATEGMAGRLIYSDAKGKGAVLECKRLGLKGIPDYVFEHEGQLIVIERKKRAVVNHRPYEGELLQLAAYCVLAEERFGHEVKVGRLQYPNETIDVPFAAGLRQRLVVALEAMRQAEQAGPPHRSHRNRNACVNCGFNSRFGEALA
jgi:CRISPR-associated exonuclease Cas4